VLRLTSLGSDSGGNALVVEAADGRLCSRVLVDNGFNLRQLERRLQRAGLGCADLDAVFVTHEHSDHVGGVAALARRHRLPVYCSFGTAAAAAFQARDVAFTGIACGEVVTIGALAVTAYGVPHDAAEPLQFTFTDGARRAGLLTDAGEATDDMLAALDRVHALVLECNHDAQILRAGAYPPFLKARIAGTRGHLSNEQAAGLLAALDRRNLQWVVAAHLSRSNNAPPLAQAALAAVLHAQPGDVVVADQDEGFGWREA
jgi:phosphoribosyl 1,2-cyclic phosphodiesterase